MDQFVQTMPLPLETYQQIHFTALRRATQALHQKAVPCHIDVEHLKRREYWNGPDSFLIHPTDIERIFSGVTLDVYHTVETLYCSRVSRSIHMVWQLVNAMASQRGGEEITYEAIWAICLYLEERRRANVDVSVARGRDHWWIGEVVPDIQLQTHHTVTTRPSILCVIDTVSLKVLSFRIAVSGTSDENIALALYDALTLQRKPHRLAVAGLLWHLPQRIMSEVALPANCLLTCRRMGIEVDTTTQTLPMLQTIRDRWATGLAGRVLQFSHCAVQLDAYLSKHYSYGPLRERERRDQEFAGAIGYSRDPAWQFPLLRALLPQKMSIITRDGAVVWDNIQYTDELLPYWPGCAVTLRRSTQAVATIWVYLQGEVLCQATKYDARWRDRSSEEHPLER